MTNTHDLLGRTSALSADENRNLIAFIIGYSPEAVDAALTHLSRFRTNDTKEN